ncbi:MAG: hypothetical protein PHR83_18135 [Paludibacter sp.]|nr:hypothetical protein [Paludibacter sp.]
MRKIIFLFVGGFITIIGLFLTFGIIIYSGKEKDNSMNYLLVVSFAILFSGVYILTKGITKKKE